MNPRRALCESFDLDPETLFIDGHDDSIVGIATQIGRPPVVLYDRERIIQNLINEGMTEEDAIEHFEFNIVGGWVGEYTPVFVTFAPTPDPRPKTQKRK